MTAGQLKISLALGLVYLIWGTSYYAIGVGVQSIDPFLFCGLRFLIAAPLLFGVGMLRGEALPDNWQLWLFNAASGILLMGVSSSLLAWGQQVVPSSQSALIVATSALWIALFSTLGKKGQPLAGKIWLSVIAGILGLAMVIETNIAEWHSMGAGYLAILGSALSLSIATILIRNFGDASNPLVTAASHLLFSGVVVVAIGIARTPVDVGNWKLLTDPEAVTALIYVAVFNSSIAVAAYYWLIHRVSPGLLGSFAYVTPVVAIASGHLMGGEVMTLLQTSGGLLIVIAICAQVLPSGFLRGPVHSPVCKKNHSIVAK